MLTLLTYMTVISKAWGYEPDPEDSIFPKCMPSWKAPLDLHCATYFNKFVFALDAYTEGSKRIQWKCWHANLTMTEGEEEVIAYSYSNFALLSCCKVVGTLLLNKTSERGQRGEIVKYDDPGILMDETVTCNAPYVHSLTSRDVDFAMVLYWKTAGKECVRNSSIAYFVRSLSGTGSITSR